MVKQRLDIDERRVLLITNTHLADVSKYKNIKVNL